MNERVSLWVNGDHVVRDVEPRRLLSDFLRHDLSLVGTHVGCEQGVCGACTVLVDGSPVRSCLTFAVQCHGERITTVEGLTEGGSLSPLQEAFSRNGALQCGFCTPGFLTTLTALLDSEPNPTEERIVEEVSANVCRCTGYHGILNAVRSVIAERNPASGVSVEVQR
jgi:aerobic-type carbon monoxide dehydrogenase small subunit (CoxS/CutS family)